MAEYVGSCGESTIDHITDEDTERSGYSVQEVDPDYYDELVEELEDKYINN